MAIPEERTNDDDCYLRGLHQGGPARIDERLNIVGAGGQLVGVHVLFGAAFWEYEMFSRDRHYVMESSECDPVIVVRMYRQHQRGYIAKQSVTRETLLIFLVSQHTVADAFCNRSLKNGCEIGA